MGVADAAAESLRAQGVDVGHALEPAPDRAHVVDGLALAELVPARDQSGPSGCVHQPATPHPRGSIVFGGIEGVGRSAFAQLDPTHAHTRAHAHPIGAIHVEQIALDPGAIDLEGGMEGEVDRAGLAHLLQLAASVGVVEEVAQAVLRKLVLVEVARKALASDQVVARDLDGGFAHLVGSLGRLLEEADGELRGTSTQLPRQQVAGESAPQNGNVELVDGHALPPRVGQPPIIASRH